jgi:hypothetical protein
MKARVPLILGFLVLGGTALAGHKVNSPVIVDLADRSAQGSLGSARNSTDTFQHIGCEVTSATWGHQVTCAARDAAGVTASCVNLVDDGMRDTVRAMNGDSYLVFRLDEIGQCTQITVRNRSELAPKK